MSASSGISSQTWCGCIQFAYLFKCMSVWWLFALMKIREVWGDSLVVPAVALVASLSRYKSVFCCSHQTKIVLCQNHSHSTYICSDWLCDRYPISKVINCLSRLSNNTCWFQVWNSKNLPFFKSEKRKVSPWAAFWWNKSPLDINIQNVLAVICMLYYGKYNLNIVFQALPSTPQCSCDCSNEDKMQCVQGSSSFGPCYLETNCAVAVPVAPGRVLRVFGWLTPLFPSYCVRNCTGLLDQLTSYAVCTALLLTECYRHEGCYVNIWIWVC